LRATIAHCACLAFRALQSSLQRLSIRVFLCDGTSLLQRDVALIIDEKQALGVQVEQLKGEVKALQSANSTAQGDVARLQSQVVLLQEEKKALEREMESTQFRVNQTEEVHEACVRGGATAGGQFCLGGRKRRFRGRGVGGRGGVASRGVGVLADVCVCVFFV
jgi:hypothetical protein